MLMTVCAYSCTQYGLHTEYMLLTHPDDLLCLQLNTLQSPHTVQAANPCRWLAVPTAKHSTVSIYFHALVFHVTLLITLSCQQTWGLARLTPSRHARAGVRSTAPARLWRRRRGGNCGRHYVPLRRAWCSYLQWTRSWSPEDLSWRPLSDSWPLPFPCQSFDTK